ncbi:stalk domain-containing protein [Paenibacillus amylolyticus]|nr:stalk domain-containing protein [Paenibacillus amylolyticus]
MRDKVKGLLIGITIGSMLTGVTAYAASGTPIKALLQKVNIYVDGTKKLTANAITYNNTTYVPVRSISTALGENVALKSNNLYIGKQPLIKLTGNQAFELLYKKKKKKSICII